MRTSPGVGIQLMHVAHKLSSDTGRHRLGWKSALRQGDNSVSMCRRNLKESLVQMRKYAYSNLGMSCDVYLDPKTGSSALP